MHTNTTLKWTAAIAAAAALAGCGGGGGSPDPAPAPGPAPAPAPAPAGKTTVTLNNEVTRPDATSGPIYGRIGDRAYARTEITSADLLCGSQIGNRSCTLEIDAGKTLTLAAVESEEPSVGQIPTGGFLPGAFLNRWQFVSWSAPCTTPERGSCVIAPAAPASVTVLWKPFNVTTLGFIGLREWRASLDGPPLLAIGSLYTGLRQQKVYTYNAQSPVWPYCIGGPTAKDCFVALTSDSTSLTLEPLPISTPGSTTALAFRGWGGACASAGLGSCTTTAIADQAVTLKWEYYLCTGGGGQQTPGWGASGWRYPPGSFPECVLQSP